MVTRIIKIGGASITEKNRFETAKFDQIDFIVNLFKDNYQNLILIHGAGSFGHHQAKKYRLNEGYLAENDFDQGRSAVCDTRRSVVRLREHLVEAFLRAGVPIIALSPFDYLQSDRFEIVEQSFRTLLERLEQLLKEGFVPMLHGDVLLDRTHHWRIYSGDDLLLKLAEYFQPKLCAFLTSVPGVLRADGSVIEEYFVDENEFDAIDSTNLIDVTGSMKNKVTIAGDLLRKVPHCQVYILQGVGDNARALISGSNDILHGSTRMKLKSNVSK